jgi:hypothetical protein
VRRATAAEQAELDAIRRRQYPGIPANCWACPNLMAQRQECSVLNALRENCFVLRLARENAERGIEANG